jgi:hypothetical protein
MINPLKRFYDKIVLALSLVAATWCAGWYWRQQGFIRILQREPIRPGLLGQPYEAGKIPRPEVSVARWSQPVAQSRGSGWLYEVFSPPLVTYNPMTQTFAVTDRLSRVAPAEISGGLELRSVMREPYRLQLEGYLGGPNDYVAAFTSPLSPETLLARRGHRFEALSLTLKSFAVQKNEDEGGNLLPGCDVVAQAVLQDEAMGTEVVLDSRTRKLTDTPLAEIKIRSAPGEPRRYHEGDTFADDVASYRVARIQLNPPEVVLARMIPGLTEPEMSVLRPLDQVPRKDFPQKPLSSQVSKDVATANQ